MHGGHREGGRKEGRGPSLHGMHTIIAFKPSARSYRVSGALTSSFERPPIDPLGLRGIRQIGKKGKLRTTGAYPKWA